MRFPEDPLDRCPIHTHLNLAYLRPVGWRNHRCGGCRLRRHHDNVLGDRALGTRNRAATPRTWRGTGLADPAVQVVHVLFVRLHSLLVQPLGLLPPLLYLFAELLALAVDFGAHLLRSAMRLLPVGKY